MVRRCSHLQTIREVTPSADGCEECLAIGAEWVHLRLCLTWRPRGLLRRLTQPPRDEALPRHQASDRPIVRAGRGLEVVLRRRVDDPLARAPVGERLSSSGTALDSIGGEPWAQALEPSAQLVRRQDGLARERKGVRR
jgi:hypothetical protein